MSTHNISSISDLKAPPKHDKVPLLYINLILQTGFIKGTKPLSTILIAQAGLGKTIKLERLRRLSFVKYSMDMTGKQLVEFLHQVDRGDKKFLVIPDYISILGHANKTKNMFRGYLRAMMDEGVSDIDVYGMTAKFNNSPHAGLITAITPEYYEENHSIWRRDGFLQRFLPFSYSHDAQTTNSIMDNIRDRKDTVNLFKLGVKRKVAKMPDRTNEIDAQMRLIAYEIKDKDAPPYRAYIQIISLCNASAVLRGSDKVEMQDIDLIRSLSTYINRKRNPI